MYNCLTRTSPRRPTKRNWSESWAQSYGKCGLHKGWTRGRAGVGGVHCITMRVRQAPPPRVHLQRISKKISGAPSAPADLKRASLNPLNFVNDSWPYTLTHTYARRPRPTAVPYVGCSILCAQHDHFIPLQHVRKSPQPEAQGTTAGSETECGAEMTTAGHGIM